MISQSCHFYEEHSYDVTIVYLFSLRSYMIAQFLALSVGPLTAIILAGHGNCDKEVFPNRHVELSNSVVSIE